MGQPLPPIILVLETVAPPDEVWTTLTEPDRIAEWFTEASPLGAVGDPYRLAFGDGSVVEGVVTELMPGQTFSHTWAWADEEPAGDAGSAHPTQVTWLVEPVEGGGTRVTLTHGGWAEAGVDEAIRTDHEAYWSGYLEDLEAILRGID
jgi:uncharacterized protein YndB with AHSA1/START domain